MKIHPLGAELFHADQQTGKHDKATSRFPQFCERAKNHRLVSPLLASSTHSDGWYMLTRRNLRPHNASPFAYQACAVTHAVPCINAVWLS